MSNVSLEQLQALCEQARVTPRFVQNRCFATDAWDRDIRTFCAARGIIYQAFSLLTANCAALIHSTVQQLAQHHGRTPAQIIFRFALDLGMLPLTGTTSAAHMREDLAVLDFQLTAEECERIEHLLA